jgi:phosphonopyruvate decarboxylase
VINTEEFVDKLIKTGFTHLCVVPCSFAKSLINASINKSDQLEYVPCASEAVACSVAAGLRMSGKRPIVIVQSSGLTNMGSCITSLLKPYDIKFPIIVSWRTYKEGDSEIQHKHLATRLPDLVDAYGYKSEVLIDDENKVIDQIISAESETKILLLENGFFSKVDLEGQNQLDLSHYIPRSKFLEKLNLLYSGSDYAFIGTTGNAAREMYSLMPDTKNFYMAGNMGGALSLGLGGYLGGKNIMVIGGDAEFVMHMGGMTTAARYKNQESGKLIYIMFDNESNKSTGGQNTYQAHLNYIEIAKGAGFEVYEKTIFGVDEFEKVLGSDIENNQLYFLHVKCSYDDEMPRPPMMAVKESVSVFGV